MAVSAPSPSFAEAQAAYLENADYAAASSLTKARAFVTAGRRLLVLVTTGRIPSGASLDFTGNLDAVREQIRDAERWIALQPDPSATDARVNGGVRHFSFAGYRD